MGQTKKLVDEQKTCPVCGADAHKIDENEDEYECGSLEYCPGWNPRYYDDLED